MKRNKLTVHILDGDYLVADDVRNKYSWDKNFRLHHSSSVDGFLKNLNSIPIRSKALHVVILVLNSLPAEIDKFSELAGKIEEIVPGIPIININNRNGEKESLETLKNSNIIHLANNENSLMRIDNALKLFVAKANVDKKRTEYRFYLSLFLIFFFTSVIIYLLGWLRGS